MPALPDDQRALLAAVIDRPDDDTPRLVYADWLDDHGNGVQANYIRDSVRLATLPPNDPDRPTLERRLTAVLEENADEWAIALGRAPAATGMCYRRGFVHTLRYGSLADYFDHAAGWYDTAPVQGLRLDLDVRDLLTWTLWFIHNSGQWEEFVGRPELARLRSLTISGFEVAEDVWMPLLAAPTLSGLREFAVPACNWTDEELEVFERQPHLAGLEVLDLGDVPADQIVDGLEATAGGHHFPGLRALYFGGPATDWGALDPLLAGALTERFGDHWGAGRPPPPVWC